MTSHLGRSSSSILCARFVYSWQVPAIIPNALPINVMLYLHDINVVVSLEATRDYHNNLRTPYQYQMTLFFKSGNRWVGALEFNVLLPAYNFGCKMNGPCHALIPLHHEFMDERLPPP